MCLLAASRVILVMPLQNGREIMDRLLWGSARALVLREALWLSRLTMVIKIRVLHCPRRCFQLKTWLGKNRLIYHLKTHMKH